MDQLIHQLCHYAGLLLTFGHIDVDQTAFFAILKLGDDVSFLAGHGGFNHAQAGTLLPNSLLQAGRSLEVVWASSRLPGFLFTGVQLPVAGFFMTAPAFTSCSAHSTDETAVPELLDTLSTSSSTPDNFSAAPIKMGPVFDFNRFVGVQAFSSSTVSAWATGNAAIFLGLLFFFSGVPFPGCFFSGVPFPVCFFSGVPFLGCYHLIVAMTSSTEGCVFHLSSCSSIFAKAKCRISAMQLRIELISAMVSLPLQAVFQAFLAVFLFNFSTSHSFKKWLCFMQASKPLLG